jgi:protein tyrosine phosphatase
MSSSSSCCFPRKLTFHFSTARDEFVEEEEAKEVLKEQFIQSAGLDFQETSLFLMMKYLPQKKSIYMSPNPVKRPISVDVANAYLCGIRQVCKGRRLIPASFCIDRSSLVIHKIAMSFVYKDNYITVPKCLDKKSSEYLGHTRINASPFLGSVPYIFTQAPMEKTLPDFIRMILFYQTRVIVSLVNPIEKNGNSGIETCLDYWRKGVKGENFSILRKKEFLVLEDRNEKLHFSKLLFTIDGVTRKVMHCWFENWTDGEGASSALLRKLAIFIQREHEENKGTVTVHCRVGLGRTGTCVAITEGIAGVKRSERISIPGIISRLREARPYMVLNQQQYACIHNTINDYFHEES